jgi:hypothetical protein
VLFSGSYYIILALPRTGLLYPSGHSNQEIYCPFGKISLIGSSEVYTAMVAL